MQNSIQILTQGLTYSQQIKITKTQQTKLCKERQLGELHAKSSQNLRK